MPPVKVLNLVKEKIAFACFFIGIHIFYQIVSGFYGRINPSVFKIEIDDVVCFLGNFGFYLLQNDRLARASDPRDDFYKVGIKKRSYRHNIVFAIDHISPRYKHIILEDFFEVNKIFHYYWRILRIFVKSFSKLKGN